MKIVACHRLAVSQHLIRIWGLFRALSRIGRLRVLGLRILVIKTIVKRMTWWLMATGRQGLPLRILGTRLWAWLRRVREAMMVSSCQWIHRLPVIRMVTTISWVGRLVMVLIRLPCLDRIKWGELRIKIVTRSTFRACLVKVIRMFQTGQTVVKRRSESVVTNSWALSSR